MYVHTFKERKRKKEKNTKNLMKGKNAHMIHMCMYVCMYVCIVRIHTINGHTKKAHTHKLN